MSRYLLSVHTVEGEAREQTPEEMQLFMERVHALEAEMRAADAFVFTGGLHGADQARVVHRTDSNTVVTDGPFAETKEHIGGFYVINAVDLDAAVAWAAKVVDAIQRPIEVRQFFDMSEG